MRLDQPAAERDDATVNTSITVRMPVELAQWVKAIARANQKSVGHIVRNALERLRDEIDGGGE